MSTRSKERSSPRALAPCRVASTLVVRSFTSSNLQLSRSVLVAFKRICSVSPVSGVNLSRAEPRVQESSVSMFAPILDTRKRCLSRYKMRSPSGVRSVTTSHSGVRSRSTLSLMVKTGSSSSCSAASSWMTFSFGLHPRRCRPYFPSDRKSSGTGPRVISIRISLDTSAFVKSLSSSGIYQLGQRTYSIASRIVDLVESPGPIKQTTPCESVAWACSIPRKCSIDISWIRIDSPL